METQSEKKTPLKHDKLTLRLSSELHDRLRAAVFHAQRTDPGLTLSSVTERGLELALDELESQYGVPNEQGPVKLRSGSRFKMT